MLQKLNKLNKDMFRTRELLLYGVYGNLFSKVPVALEN